MDLLSNVINAIVMAAVGLALWLLVRGKLEAIEQRIERLEARVDRLEAEVSARIDSLRSDLTQVALAVGAAPRADTGG